VNASKAPRAKSHPERSLHDLLAAAEALRAEQEALVLKLRSGLATYTDLRKRTEANDVQVCFSREPRQRKHRDLLHEAKRALAETQQLVSDRQRAADGLRALVDKARQARDKVTIEHAVIQPGHFARTKESGRLLRQAAPPPARSSSS